jgi:hypothetical protein
VNEPGGKKALAEVKVALPLLDDDEEEDTVVIKKASGGNISGMMSTLFDIMQVKE